MSRKSQKLGVSGVVAGAVEASGGALAGADAVGRGVGKGGCRRASGLPLGAVGAKAGVSNAGHFHRGGVMSRVEALELVTAFARDAGLPTKERLAAVEILARMQGYNEPEKVTLGLSASLIELSQKGGGL